MDIYQPPSSDTVKNRPFIVWMHGGQFMKGNRSGMKTYAIEFARRGYVSASISYRLSAKSLEDVPTAVLDAREDAMDAINYLKQNAGTYGLDPNKGIIGGYSAGSLTSQHIGYRYEEMGLGAPPVAGVAGIDSWDLDAPISYPILGDPPFIYIRSGIPAPDLSPNWDRGLSDLMNAAARILDFSATTSAVHGASHGKLNAPEYLPGISSQIATSLYQYLIAPQGVINQPPVANAGADQTVTDTNGDGKESVTLDGSGSSDPDGKIVTYSWVETFPNQKKHDLNLATGVKPTVALAVGTHTIVLSVTDDKDAPAVDTGIGQGAFGRGNRGGDGTRRR
jgi:hypothetical protein